MRKVLGQVDNDDYRKAMNMWSTMYTTAKEIGEAIEERLMQEDPKWGCYARFVGGDGSYFDYDLHFSGPMGNEDTEHICVDIGSSFDIDDWYEEYKLGKEMKRKMETERNAKKDAEWEERRIEMAIELLVKNGYEVTSLHELANRDYHCDKAMAAEAYDRRHPNE